MSGGEARDAGRSTPRTLNPLWIISLFVGVSETTVGVATTQASGWIQGLLATFAVIFPVLVSGAFFVILWKKPEVLYAPGDFPEHVPVPDFVLGLHQSAPNNLELISSVLRQTLESVLPAALEPEVPAGSVDTVVSRAVSSAQADLISRAIKVDFALIYPEIGQFDMVVDDTITISEFLDWLWGKVAFYIPPITYGEKWVLVDRHSLRAFDEMGRQWATSHGHAKDNRRLGEVGITPGMELMAVPKQADWLAFRATTSSASNTPQLESPSRQD